MPTFLLQHLTPRAADALANPSFMLALAGTLIGFGLWATGARYSRGMITLLAVAVGGILGGHLPAWRGWDVNPMGTVIVCTLAVGFAGYLLHTTCVGVFLSLLLALSASAAVWAVWGQGATWQMPVVEWASSPDLIADTFWKSLPAHLNRSVPIAFAIGFGAGVVLMVARPKVGTALAYSLIGTPLLIAFGLPLLQTLRPQWYEAIPTAAPARWVLAAAVVALGTLVQWLLLPRKRKGAANAPKSETNPNPPTRQIDESAPAKAPPTRRQGSNPVRSPRVAEVVA